MDAPVLVEVRRGALVESVHRGRVAVADASGRIHFSCGDASAPAALRSAAKPFQLLPLVESGAADRFGFTEAELAVMAGSHSGTPAQVAAVRSALSRAGLEESALLCGAHPPYDAASAEKLRAAGESPQPIHNNCSGKHAAMLALAIHLKGPLAGYLQPDHPVQRAILSALSKISGVAESSIGIATDGCSAPTFFLPLSGAATAFARLAAADENAGPAEAALARIRRAMVAHADFVAGPDRFDTVLMAAEPRVCAKSGAEGFQGLAVAPEGTALGVAIKIEDGSSRAVAPCAIEVLKQILWKEAGVPKALEARRGPVIKNHKGTAVGQIRAVARLASA